MSKMNQNEFAIEFEKLNEVLVSLPSFDDGSVTFELEIQSYTGNSLRIIGGRDLSLKYHEVEILLDQVHWIDLPTNWQIESVVNCIRLVIPSQQPEQIERRTVYQDYQLFEFSNCLSGNNGFVAAERVAVTTGVCFHYERKELKPGQRIADWVAN